MKNKFTFLKLFIFLLCSGILISFTQQSNEEKPNLVFEKTEHDFGKIRLGEGSVRYCFIFRNEGNAPLIINNVKSTCGCSFAYWSKEPIAPNETDSICVSYKNNISGFFKKTLKVYSNSDPKKINLIIKGETIK
jgi:hypothetical protein